MVNYIQDYISDEKYDISKFMKYEDGVYDTVGSIFFAKVKLLPTVSYYSVNDGYREVDIIAQKVYGSVFFSYLIQLYNNMFIEVFPEGTILNLFSANDLENLYSQLSIEQNLNKSSDED